MNVFEVRKGEEKEWETNERRYREKRGRRESFFAFSFSLSHYPSIFSFTVRYNFTFFWSYHLISLMFFSLLGLSEMCILLSDIVIKLFPICLFICIFHLFLYAYVSSFIYCFILISYDYFFSKKII